MKKPLFAIFTDTHLEREEHIPLNEAISKEVVDFAQQNRCMAIHAGDWFTDRKRITLDENLLPLNGMFDYAKDMDVKIHGIPGNHDKTDQTRDASYLDVYRHHPGMELHDGPSIHTVKNVHYCFLPYYLEKDGTYGAKLANLTKLLKQTMETGDKAILITHIAVNGVRNNDGSQVDSGIGVNLFDAFDLVLIGHYHNRQELKRKKTHLVYIGSAFQRNFGEDADKGWAVVYDDLSIEYKKFKFPKYFKETFKLPSDSGKLKIKTRYYKKRFEKGIKQFVRFKLIGSRQELLGVDVAELKRCGIQVEKETDTMLRNIQEASEGDVFSFDENMIKREFIIFAKENSIKGDKLKFGLKMLKDHV